MLQNPIFLIGISALFAAIPVAAWLYIFFRKSDQSRKVVAMVFFIGCFTAPALLGLQHLWDIFPQFNLASSIENGFQNQTGQFIAMFLLFAAMEEIIKMFVIIEVDKRTILIKTVSDALRFSFVSALGFAFVENIYYLYQFWPSLRLGELVGMYLFRSVFTACAHTIFSGIFGYHYGIGKFSIDITRQAKLAGEKQPASQFISKIFNLPISHAYQQQMLVKGLTLAIFIHATYNLVLQYNKVVPVVIFVIMGFFYLRYLLKRKAGNLIMTTDISEKQKSTLAKKDEEVVEELLGMWFQDKRYVDVIHISERLLERDPDNNVVKLFKARALDNLDKKNIYHEIFGNLFKSQDQLSENDKNIISKYTTEKEIFNKVQEMIKKQLKKEGKEFKENPKKTPPKTKNEGPLEPYTKGDDFNLNI